MGEEKLPLAGRELEQVERVARLSGRTHDDVATDLVQKALARRVRKRTGKAPARVYGMRRK